MNGFKIDNRISGYLCAVGATAIWSGNFIVARGLSDAIPPISLAFWRWVVAVAVFLPVAVKPMMAERALLNRHKGYLSVTALLGVTVFNTLIYTAGHSTSAVNLSLIAITFPVFILILSRWLFQESITVGKSVGLLMVATGVVALISKGNITALLDLRFAIGDLWMLMASFIFAVYSILLKQKPAGLSIWSLQLSTFLLGLFFLLPFFIAERMVLPPVVFETRTVLSILYVGIFASLSAFILWHNAIAAIGPTRAGMIYYTLPLFSGVLAYLFLDEAIGMVHLVSALLIIGGILSANRAVIGNHAERPTQSP